MPRHCAICSNPFRQDIEKALARGRSLRWLAGKYQVSKSAIHRHARHPLLGWVTDEQLIRALTQPRRVRGNPDKTKPYRWKPGRSGNPHGRTSTPPWDSGRVCLME